MTQMQAAIGHSLNSIGDAFDRGFERWLQGGKSFTASMGEAFRSMAAQQIASLEQVAMRMLIHLALVEITGKKEQLISAKVAAADAFRAAGSLPFPANLIVGGLSAAAVFAAAMSFEKGGMTPASGGPFPALLHPRERVLTAAETTAYNAGQSTVNNRGGDTHSSTSRDMHYHAARGESPHSVTQNTAALKRAMRDGALRFA
jgi:hypothetical protein